MTKQVPPASVVTPLTYSTAEAAKILHRGQSTLEHWRLLGIGPPFVRNPGGVGVLYTHSGLVRWLSEQEELEQRQRRARSNRASPIRSRSRKGKTASAAP